MKRAGDDEGKNKEGDDDEAERLKLLRRTTGTASLSMSLSHPAHGFEPIVAQPVYALTISTTVHIEQSSSGKRA